MSSISITLIERGPDGTSRFSACEWPLSDLNGMFISERQNALNFRHRLSHPGYASDWHVAGDPTLIIVRQGALQLEMRSGETRTFNTGDQFIAADYLLPDETLADHQGHRAQVLGNKALLAVHIKLSDQPGPFKL